MTEKFQVPLPEDSQAAETHLEALQVFHDFALSISLMLDQTTLLPEITAQVAQIVDSKRVLLLISDPESITLKYGTINAPPDDPILRDQLERFSLSTFNSQSDTIIAQWLNNQAVQLTKDAVQHHTALNWLVVNLETENLYSVPLFARGKLTGILIIDTTDGALNSSAQARLDIIRPAIGIALLNASIYTDTVHKSSSGMNELYILRQIDRELNDTIELEHVFNIALDWTLRFTSAQAASLSLYDQGSDEMRLMRHYGYDILTEELQDTRPYRGGIAHRVALAGKSEVIPDVAMDKDFIRVTSFTKSQISVPVLREDRVIAVITVESRKINGFSDEHMEFVEKLAARAGVAIDNARLFAETKREREKLSHILSNTADIVIVTALDDRIILINPSAYQALRLYPHETYVGLPFADALGHTQLVDVYKKARGDDEVVMEEIVLPNERTFHINLTKQDNIGTIIVMHDITPFKEMDQLKSELIATVSHDLKQPLSVMNGYTELLLLHRQFDATGISFIDMVRKSIQNMRQLIDDLLDLAKIESGIKLDIKPISLKPMILQSIESLEPTVKTKNMDVSADIPDDLPSVRGDSMRLQQVLHNLIGNAVKYTQPGGTVLVRAEVREHVLRISIQDNGMGISPEDQVHIFDRFYRVRRPETDSIEGTGLGLAIVKSLVEAHEGKISLESRLGEGTTFIVTLPVYVTETPLEA